MTIYHVFQPGNARVNLYINASELRACPDCLTKVQRAFTVFQKKVEAHHLKIYQATQPLVEKIPASRDIVLPFHQVYHIAITPDMISTIYKIIVVLKTGNYIDKESFRFKIEGLSFVTIFKSVAENVFAVHLKKKPIRTLLGEGFSSKVFTTVVFKGRDFELYAEKTLYRQPFAFIRKAALSVRDQFLFCNDARASYKYEALDKTSLGHKIKNKHCQILDLYEMALCELLDLDSEHNLLAREKLFEVAKTVVRVVKNLHDKNIVHRDLKPDNFLVKFNFETREFDWNDFSIVASDYDTFVLERECCFIWTGTPSYHPPTKDRQRQNKSVDIYALGVFFEFLFKKILPDPALEAFIAGLKDLAIEERFTIDEVTCFLDQHF